MIENIDRVLERGERIELLVDKTDRLSQQAYKFEKSVCNPTNIIDCYLALCIKVCVLSTCHLISLRNCSRALAAIVQVTKEHDVLPQSAQLLHPRGHRRADHLLRHRADLRLLLRQVQVAAATA